MDRGDKFKLLAYLMIFSFTAITSIYVSAWCLGFVVLVNAVSYNE